MLLEDINYFKVIELYDSSILNIHDKHVSCLEQDNDSYNDIIAKYLKRVVLTRYSLYKNSNRIDLLSNKLKIYKSNSQVNTIKDDRLSLLFDDPSKGQFTPYEQAVYNVCNTFNIIYTITSTDTSKKCVEDFVFEIVNKGIDECVISAISLTEYIQNCNYSINISEEECILAYNMLLKEEENCNLSFKQYHSLIKLGWTPESILTIYSNQYTLTPDGKTINTLLTSYQLSDLCFSDPYTGTGNKKDFLIKALEGVDMPQNIKDEIINS